LAVNPAEKRTVSDDLAEQQLRTEEALRAHERSFQLIVDSIPVPVAVTTPTGEVEALNQQTLEYFGKTFEELKGWTSSTQMISSARLQRSKRLTRRAAPTTSRAVTAALMVSTVGSMSAVFPCEILKGVFSAGFTC
jgi:PAS domain S-box-containing protein